MNTYTYGNGAFTRTSHMSLSPYFNYQHNNNNRKIFAVHYASYKVDFNKLNKFKQCLSASSLTGKTNINSHIFSWSQNKGISSSCSIIKTKFILTHKTKNDYICYAQASIDSKVTTEDKKEIEVSIGFFAKLSKMLTDFGMGRRSQRDGSTGMLILVGTGLFFALLNIVGTMRSRGSKPYNATLSFPQACGITVGTPVRIRGVAIGSTLRVKPKLDGVDVDIEVRDDATIIPRNSVIEANQSGLIAEPFIDITPQVPVPENKFGPLDIDCEGEESILCHGGRLSGEQGVSLDDLVYICTKLARQLDQEGVDSVFRAAESLAAALDSAQPLIEQSGWILKELTPLLNDLRKGGMVDNVESLSHSIALAASHLEQLQKAILDQENVLALKDSVQTLTNTLKSIERMASNASEFTSDHRVMSNLKRLIEAMGRMMED